MKIGLRVDQMQRYPHEFSRAGLSRGVVCYLRRGPNPSMRGLEKGPR